jgi:hypothetical protein
MEVLKEMKFGLFWRGSENCKSTWLNPLICWKDAMTTSRR